MRGIKYKTDNYEPSYQTTKPEMDELPEILFESFITFTQ